GGPLTGRGGNLIVMDDVVKSRVEADSEAIRKATWDWFSSTLSTRSEPGAAIVFCCTRWHEQDLAGMLLDRGGWELLSMPAISDQGEALWPERNGVNLVGNDCQLRCRMNATISLRGFCGSFDSRAANSSAPAVASCKLAKGPTLIRSRVLKYHRPLTSM